MDNFEHITNQIYENYITPLDRCTIKTRFEIHAEAITSKEAFNEKHGTSIIKSSLNSEQTTGEVRQTAKLSLVSYNGILAFCRKEGNSWFVSKIQFNARNIHHHHNAKPINATQFMSALTNMRDSFTPLLVNPADWIDIIPGVQKNSKAYWSLLEIACDFDDEDGSLEEALNNAHYPYTSEGFRYDKGTRQLGCTKGPFKIKLYRKDLEIAQKVGKNKVCNAPRVFRVELILSQNKLIELLGHEDNVEQIDGVNRLVRFNPEHLVLCHQKIFSKLKGCFMSRSETKQTNDKTGRLMALISAHYNIPLIDLLKIYETEIVRRTRKFDH